MPDNPSTSSRQGPSIRASSEHSRPELGSKAQPNSPGLSQKTVLIAEDDPFLGSLLSNRLSKAGLSVTRAADGEEVLNILKNLKPDLILLDIILPKKSGFEVMEEIRKDPLLKRAPIVIISNLGQNEDMARGKQLGAIEYYVKAETSIEDLASKVRQILGVKD